MFYSVSEENIAPSASMISKAEILCAKPINKVLNMHRVNTLPNNKLLDWSKLKPFADDKINAT